MRDDTDFDCVLIPYFQLLRNCIEDYPDEPFVKEYVYRTDDLYCQLRKSLKEFYDKKRANEKT